MNDEDRQWFEQLVKSKLADFNTQAGEVLGEGPLLYGDFMMPNTDTKNYEEITDHEKVSLLGDY